MGSAISHPPSGDGSIGDQAFGRELLAIADGASPGKGSLPPGVFTTSLKLDHCARTLRRVEAELPGLPESVQSVVADAMKDIYERVCNLGRLSEKFALKQGGAA